MKYSIVTPNYNGFSLMNRFFQSLEDQIYKDFEVIVIDDCSTDNSYEELLDYSQRSPLEIKVFRTDKNSGPGNARNIGMEKARGEWITFLDNDDWVEKSFLSDIDEVICNHQVNCVVYDYYIKSDDKETVGHSMYKGEEGMVSISECVKYVRNHSIGKVYRRDICNHIRYPLTRRCEDVAFVARAVEACGSVYYLKKPLYYYYQRPASLSNNKKMDASDMIKAFTIIEDNLASKYPNEIAEKSVTDLLYGAVLMMCKAKKSNKEIREYIEWYNNKYPKWYDSEIIHQLGKTKRLFLQFVKFKNVLLLKGMAFIHAIIVG